MAFPFAPIIGAGISALGSFLGGKSQDKAAAKAAKQNIAMQKEFAQNAIQWKAADSLKAGIHPLFGLGAQTTSFSPISVGGGGVGAAMADMGQDIGRAVAAGGNATDRKLIALQLERAGLENKLLESQIMAINRTQSGPPSPVGARSIIPGQEQLQIAGVPIKTDPKTTDVQDFEQRYGEPAEWFAAPFVAWQDMKKNLEGKSFGEIMRMIDRATRIW